MGIMRGMIQSLDGLAKKIGSSYNQPPPLVVVLDSSKTQSFETLKVERYVALPKRDSEFSQPSMGKEIAESPAVVGVRPNQYAPRVGQLGPSSIHSIQTPLIVGRDWSPSGLHQNFKQTYNPF